MNVTLRDGRKLFLKDVELYDYTNEIVEADDVFIHLDENVSLPYCKKVGIVELSEDAVLTMQICEEIDDVYLGVDSRLFMPMCTKIKSELVDINNYSEKSLYVPLMR